MVLTIILTALITIIAINIISFILTACCDNGYMSEDVIVYFSMGFITLIMFGIIGTFIKYIYKPLRLKYINKYYGIYYSYCFDEQGNKVHGTNCWYFIMKKKYEKYCYTDKYKDLYDYCWIERSNHKIKSIPKSSEIKSKDELRQCDFYNGNSK